MGNKDPDRSIGFGFSGRRGLIDVDFGEDAGLLDPALIESREERFFEIGIEGAARGRGFKAVGAELVVLTTGGRRWAGAAGGGAGRREGRGDGCGEGSFEEIATGDTHKKKGELFGEVKADQFHDASLRRRGRSISRAESARRWHCQVKETSLSTKNGG